MKRKVLIALAIVGTLYVLLCAGVYFFQELLLFPGASRGGHVFDLPGNVTIERLRTAEGIEFRVAHGTPRDNPKEPRGVLVFFIGNGEDLSSGVHHAANFAEYGLETLVAEYPGYGKSGGRAGMLPILAAAETSAARAKKWADAAGVPLFVAGQSLGTCCAVHVVSKGFGDKLLLSAPMTSVIDAARYHYPFLPVSLLIRHPFDNLGKAAAIGIPTLIIHGDADRVLPIDMGRRLADAIPGAELVVAPGVGHNGLGLHRRGAFGSLIEKHFFE